MAENTKSAYLKTLEAAKDENTFAAEAGKLKESQEIPYEILGVVNGHLCVGILRTEPEGHQSYHFYYPNMKPKDVLASFAPSFAKRKKETPEKVEQSLIKETMNESPILSFILIFSVIFIVVKKLGLK